MLPFTFLILQKPSLASLVRSFTFRGRFHGQEDADDEECDEDEARLPWPDHPEREDILRKLVKEITISEEEESQWLQELLPPDAPKDVIIFSVLLISLPNLRRLDLEISNYEDAFFESVLNRVASYTPPFDVNKVFTQLTDIIIAGDNDRYPTQYGLFGACCRLPAVKRLYGHRLGAEEDHQQLSAPAATTSRIETSEPHDSEANSDDPSQSGGLDATTFGIDTMELRDSKLHHDDLPIVFGSLRSPHTIIYQIGNSWAWTPIRTPVILSSISIHATSLRRLAIDHEAYYPFTEGVNDDDNADPVSFIGFITLTHLRVAPLFLFGHEDLHSAPEHWSEAETAMLNRLRGALPISLESLHITNADFVFSDRYAHIGKAFEVLLRQRECVPNLRELVFEGEFKEEKSIQRAVQVIGIAEEVGINARALALPHYAYDKERGWGWDQDVSFETCMHNGIGERVQVWPKL
ncbi:hypothetical protein V492_01209 [Pseudogymnoascus sp. VKM F-4246]|nr:hypothetical protein V492_01209 [Pseudogymnoascus sp. VKM F-4246]